MTLLAIESILQDHGLRLRRAVRVGASRRWLVEVASEGAATTVEGTGVTLEDAVDNAVAAATRRTAKVRRYRS